MEMLKAYLFGNSDVRPYDENKTYNQGNVILCEGENGTITLKQPIEDEVTGPFDEKKWNEMVLSELIWRSARKVDLVIISDTQPTQDENEIWMKPVEDRSDLDLSVLFEGDTGIKIENDYVSISDERPIRLNNIIWHEPISVREEDLSGF